MSNSALLLMLAASLDKSRRKNQSLPLDAERVTRGQTLARTPTHPLNASLCLALLFYCILRLGFHLHICLSAANSLALLFSHVDTGQLCTVCVAFYSFIE